MIAQHVTSHEAVTFDDLQPLTTASGPCITMTLPLSNPAEINVRLKNAIRGVQKQLAEFGTDDKNRASLMAPLQEFAATAETNHFWGPAIILFRSPDLFQYYMLRGPVREEHTVADHFQVRPLLAAMTHEMRFHLLCLSRRHVRLFHCTQFRAEQAVRASAAGFGRLVEHAATGSHAGQSLLCRTVFREDKGCRLRHQHGPRSRSRVSRSFPGSSGESSGGSPAQRPGAALAGRSGVRTGDLPAPEQLSADSGAVNRGLTRRHDGPGPA